MIPAQLIALLTFPGVIVHEIGHQLFCRLFRVAVLDVCYFRFGNPAGYVVHETPRIAWEHVLIGMGPFFVYTVVGDIIALPGAIPVLDLGSGTVLDFCLVWLGVSIAMHAFPSTGDARSMWQAVHAPEASLRVRMIGVPLVGLIYLGSIGSIFWLDALYGFGVAMLLPTVLVRLLA
jgi:hypothetical protein